MGNIKLHYKKRHSLYLWLLPLILLFFEAAYAAPSRTTYQAKILKPDGYPLENSSVIFKFTILDPSGSCILYSENYAPINMANTGGLISFSLGSGVKSYPVSAVTFSDVFSNITPILSCDTGGPSHYSPTANDSRKIVMQFNDGNGWQTLPAMAINAVPYAMYASEAQRLNGKLVSDFVQVSSVPTCTASEALRYNGAHFSCVTIGGSGSTVTSSSVVAALGYTPADGVSVTTLMTNLSTVSSTVFAVSSTVSSLDVSVAQLVSSMSAVTSSQWSTSGTAISYVDGNVGIGTSSPQSIFHIANNVQSDVRFQNTSASASALRIVSVGSKNYIQSGQDFSTHSEADLIFGPMMTIANPRVVLKAGGNVGVGTENPITKLEVSGGVRISMESATCAVSYAGTIRYNSGSIEFCNGSTWGAMGSAAITSAAVNAAYGYTPANSSTLAVVSNAVTTVQSDILSVSSVAAAKITSSAAAISQVLGYIPVASGSVVSSQWLTSGTAISYTGGNVGIGTVSPNEKLNVAGRVSLETLGSSTDMSPMILETNTDIQNSNTTALYIYPRDTANHRVFFGTSARPVYAVDFSNSNSISGVKSLGGGNGTSLELNGSDSQYGTALFDFRPSIDNYRPVVLANGRVTDSVSSVGVVIKTVNTLNNPNAILLNVDNGNSTKMTVMANGFVGLGVSDPTVTLDIKAPSSAGITVRSTTTSSPATLNLLNDANYGTHISTGESNSTWHPNATRVWSQGLHFFANNGTGDGTISFYPFITGQYSATVPKVRFNPNGTVGIGTTSPVTKLEVSGGIKISMESATCATSFAGTIRYNSGSLEFCNGSSWGAMGSAAITSAAVNAAYGYTPANSSTLAVVSNAVTTVQADILTVSSVVGSKITSSAASIAQVLGYVPAASGGTTSQWTTSATSIHYISGNVGIGTANPAQQLEVSGSIKIPNTTTSTAGVIYKGSNSFIHDFKASLTNGRNTFIGELSGNFSMARDSNNTDASENTAVGYGTMPNLTTGYNNTAMGSRAMNYITSGTENTAVGYLAMYRNTFGHNNSALGSGALYSNITGGSNAAFGEGALEDNNTGSYNAAVGANSLNDNTTGDHNVAVGYSAMAFSSTGNQNAAIGYNAMQTNSVGSRNVALGSNALANNRGKSDSTAIGYYSMRNMDSTTTATGAFNTAVGANSLTGGGTSASNTGIRNTAIGASAMYGIISGSDNIALGYMAGYAITTGSGNVIIGGTSASVLATSSNNILFADGTGNERFRINSSGNMGVGLSSPVTRLDVSGGVRISMESATCAASYAGTLRYNAGNVELCNGSAWSGFAGTANLYTSGTVIASSYVSASSFVSGRGTSGTPSYSFNGDLDSGIFSPLANTFAITTNGVERMRIDSNGNIGIGITNPTVSLDVSGTIKSDQICTRGSTCTGTYASVLGSGNSTASGINAIVVGGHSNTAKYDHASVLGGRFNIASGTYATVVGGYENNALGTYSLAAGARTTADAACQTTIGRFNRPTGTENSTNCDITDNPLFVVGNGNTVSTLSNAFIVLKNGNVGIGGGASNTAPTATLDVAGHVKTNGGNNGVVYTAISSSPGTAINPTSTPWANVGLSMQNSSAVNGNNSIIRAYNANNQPQGAIGFIHNDHTSQYASDLFIEPRNVAYPTAFVVRSTGNIGMGTSTPTAVLQITAGTTTKGPLKLTSGTLVTSPQSGTIEYDGFNYFITDGTNTRRAIATVSGSAIGSLNGSASSTQTFAFGNFGTIPGVSTSTVGVHTFNFPLAATNGVTAGLLSNSDYTNFSGKITSSTASVIAALGYTPVTSSAASIAQVLGYVPASGGATSLSGLSDALVNTTDKNLFLTHKGGTAGSTNDNNIGIGANALDSLTNGGASNNIAIGVSALTSNTSGSSLIAIGTDALRSNLDGDNNVAVGNNSMYSNTSGFHNAGVGFWTLRSNTTGSQNTGLGSRALYANTTGWRNSSVGDYSSYYNTTGDDNSVFGQQAGFGVNGLTVANRNILIGTRAGYGIETADDNVIIGYQSGDSISTGDRNILIGYDVDLPTSATSYHLNIGNAIYGNLNNGFVGVGTASAGSRLEISESNDTALTIRSSSSIDYNTASILFYTGATSSTSNFMGSIVSYINSNSPMESDLIFNNNKLGTPQEVMRLKTDGKVGIGTSSPTTALTVSGTVRSISGGFQFPDGTIQTTANPVSGFTLIPSASGTSIGNATSNGGLAAAFDADDTETDAQSAVYAGGNGTGGWVGKDYGAGVTKIVRRWKAFPSSDFGFSNQGTNGTTMISLQYSDNTSCSTGVGYVTVQSLMAGSESESVDGFTGNTVGHRCWRVIRYLSTGETRFAEVEFYE